MPDAWVTHQAIASSELNDAEGIGESFVPVGWLRAPRRQLVRKPVHRLSANHIESAIGRRDRPEGDGHAYPITIGVVAPMGWARIRATI